MLKRTPVVLALTCVLTGCIQSDSLVKVKPDGSGTVELTMLANMAALKGLLSGMDPKGEAKMSGIFGDAEFKRTAERMGVRPLSLTPVKKGAFEGATAVYGFDDITAIRLDQDPPLSGGGARSGARATSAPIKFGFTRQGGTSVLTITVDEQRVSDAQKQASGNATAMPSLDPAMLGMIKAMFEGMRISIDLEVDGTIVKTNADYVNGSRITLIELDVAALLADEARLQALSTQLGPGASIAEAREVLKDVKGVKINRPQLTIEYR